MTTAISERTQEAEDKELLLKATEIMKLFNDAIELGYSISFTPEQLKVLVAICEEGVLYKDRD